MSKPFLHGQPTIGVLTGWMVYSEGSLNSFFEPLLQGIYAAARERQCHLLLACGVGRVTSAGKFEGHEAWPVLSPEMHFVPVGPWNTDGLIAVAPLRTEDRARYIQGLIQSGHPVVYISPEGHPSVAIDNAGGIRQALTHLIEHGHRRIAFISGKQQTEADSLERLDAYLAAVQEYGLESDPGLIVQGFHDQPGGYQAMQQLLASDVSFTAVLASNDESAMGALRALREAGRRIPRDVAMIGFDDRLEAPAQQPPLTSVYHPLFESGYQSLQLLLQCIEGKTSQVESIRLPTHLVIRQSCGCPAGPMLSDISPKSEVLSPKSEVLSPKSKAQSVKSQLAQAMVEALSSGTRTPMGDQLQQSCHHLSAAWMLSLEQQSPADFQSALTEILWQLEEVEEDAHIWHAALNVLQAWLAAFRDGWDWPVSYSEAEALLHQARIAISDHVRRRYDRYLVAQRSLANQMSFFSARLLLALDQFQIMDILAQSLSAFGLRQAHIVFFEEDQDDPVAWSVLATRPGADKDFVTQRFPSREFPPPGLYSVVEPFHIALLPLIIQDEPSGYVAFDGANLEPCAVIVRQLAGALKSARLYREVAEGRREAEAARQLAEDANQMKSRFLSTVSHELRTPLNLIVGLSELLLQAQTTLALPEKYRADVEKIHAGAQHLSGLIRDVLDLAGSETGQLKLVNEPVDLEPVLKVVAETGEQLASDKGLLWRAEIQADLPRVWGDRTRLTQVVLNLVSNAVKFTEKGTITLEVKRKDEEGPRTKDQGPRGKENFILHNSREAFILVSVSDTGLGIPLEEQSIIFDEFRQSERTAARGYGGLGLGLAICKRLVERHGGQLWVQSSGEEGAGSTFYFTLPAFVEPETGPEIKGSPSLSKQTVVVLTGHSDNGQHLHAHLRREGFAVEEHRVDETTEWWPSLLAAPPGAVVLDLELASEQGWEILKVLKGHPATRQIPVLFYSLAQEQDVGAVLELDYLMKPIRPSELTQALARAGDKDAPAAPKEQKTILIVDDDPGILEMHARMVLEQPTAHHVLKARNGREALTVLRESPVDLVLLDLMMPEIDGFKVLEQMRETETTRDIPVIVLTAQMLSQADMTRLNRGVATILGKGLFSVQETLGHVEAALARNRELGSEAQRLVRKAMAYLHEHYADPLSREDVARSVGVSEGYLARCFRRETGVTPMIYLNRYRVHQAKALLEAGNQSITEVALAVGFSDSAYFSNVFRREVGVSPGAYRQGQRGAS